MLEQVLLVLGILLVAAILFERGCLSIWYPVALLDRFIFSRGDYRDSAKAVAAAVDAYVRGTITYRGESYPMDRVMCYSIQLRPYAALRRYCCTRPYSFTLGRFTAKSVGGSRGCGGGIKYMRLSLYEILWTRFKLCIAQLCGKTLSGFVVRATDGECTAETFYLGTEEAIRSWQGRSSGKFEVIPASLSLA